MKGISSDSRAKARLMDRLSKGRIWNRRISGVVGLEEEVLRMHRRVMEEGEGGRLRWSYSAQQH